MTIESTHRAVTGRAERASADGLRAHPPSPEAGGPLPEGLPPGLVIESEIARTGRSVVLRVGGEPVPSPVAALKLALEPGSDEELARFHHEMRRLSEATHPNVVEIYEFGVLAGGFPFVLMELAPAEALRESVAGAGWERFYEVALEASAGLAHLHRCGVLHLDLKPSNLGLAASPLHRLKVLDFGPPRSTVERLGRRIPGTLAYAAPEILLEDPYDHRADLYSLGLVLFELATGVLPSAGDDLAALRFHLEGEAPDPRLHRPDMPEELAGVLARLLARDPGQRFPSADALHGALAEAAGREATRGERSPGPGRLLASPMIGRDVALARLREAMRDASRGRGGLVLVEGEEGVGKSRLLRQFRVFAALDGARVSRGAAAGDAVRPLAPVTAALRGAGIDVTSLASTGEDVSEGERLRLFQRIAGLLSDVALAGPPLALVLEDLHLAGPDSEDLLAFLAADLAALPVLVVASRRPSQGPDEAGDGAVADPDGLERLPLEPLAPAETRRLVAACLASEGLAEAFHDWVFEQSRGNPAQVLQLLRHLASVGALVDHGGTWEPVLAAGERPRRSAGVGESVDWRRLSRLADADRRLLEAAAVAGEPLTLSALAELLDDAPMELYPRVAELVGEGFLEPFEELGGTFYGFAQRRVREALYAGLDSDRRRALHRRYGEILTADGDPGVSASTVGEHLWRGWERAASLPYLLAAAEEAGGLHAHGAAAALYARATEAAEEAGEAAAALAALAGQAAALAADGQCARALRLYHDLLHRPGVEGGDRGLAIRLWLAKGGLHGRLGEHEAALESYEAGLGLVGEAGLDEFEVELLHGRALELYDLGRLDAAFTCARGALAEATRLRLGAPRVALLRLLGLIFQARGDLGRAERLIRRGLSAAERAGARRLIFRLRNDLGAVLAERGHHDQAQEHLLRNLSFCRSCRDIWGELAVLDSLGVLACSRGRWKAAREPLAESLRMKRRAGARTAEAASRLHLGEVEEMLGEWPRAHHHCTRGLELLAESSVHPDRFALLARLASLERKRGDEQAAERLAREARAGGERLGDLDLVGRCDHLLGLLEMDREAFSRAAEHLERAREELASAGGPQARLQVDLSLAELEVRRGDPENAARILAAAKPRVVETADPYGEGRLLSIEARLACLEGRVEEAERQFAEGVDRLARLEVPYDLARSLYEWGLRTRGLAAARERLEGALAVFDDLGAETEIRRCRGAIERIREHERLAVGRENGPVLYAVGKVINSTLDLDEVLGRTMDLALERLRAERGMLVLADPLTRELELAVSRNLESAGEDERSLPENVVRRVLDRREPVLVADAIGDARFPPVESVGAGPVRSILAVPLVIREQVAGAIYVDHPSLRHLFGERDLQFLLAVADQAATAIENARLYGELEAARERLKQENDQLRQEILSSHHLGSLIGRGRAIAELKRTLERVAQSHSTVLIRGESGTGKGLVARIIHSVSARREGPFIQFNCAALPETLVESELFGHERGAFTGAAHLKPGRFELADGGTVFLDEIGKVSKSVQAKLLRVVEDKEFERVGGTKTLRSDVRIIAATNLNLEEAIRSGDFREDLFYRLNIIPIVLPPLRERREDIPYLVQHFLTQISRDLGLPGRRLDPAVLALFAHHDWPGNVRELESAIHRALVLSPNETLAAEDFAWIGLAAGEREGAVAALPSPIAPEPATDPLGDGYQEALARFDRCLIGAALERSGGRIREAARALGIARNTLKAKMKRYGLDGG